MASIQLICLMSMESIRLDYLFWLMYLQLRTEIGIQIVSYVRCSNLWLKMRSLAFPGIINWQKRLWLTVQEFIKYRNEEQKDIPNDEFREHDDYMFDSRNYYVKGATFNYCTSQQISVGISKMQGLTNSLRVRIEWYNAFHSKAFILANASRSFFKKSTI